MVDFQREVLEKVQKARVGEGDQVFFLAFSSGGKSFLIDASDIGEVSFARTIAPVPTPATHVRGVTGTLGSVYTVTDFSVFIGGQPTVVTAKSKVIALHPRHESSVAIIVDSIDGIRGVTEIGDAAAVDGSVNAALKARHGDSIMIDTQLLIDGLVSGAAGNKSN